MEWYYILGIIVSSLGAIGWLTYRINNLIRNDKDNKKDIDELKSKWENFQIKFEENNRSKDSDIAEIKSDLKLINQKFDLYIKQILELNTKQSTDIEALKADNAKHSNCLFYGKSPKDVKELII